MLSNILLDELDKELDRRGLRYVRYADDVIIYVGSKGSSERDLQSVTKYIEAALLLKLNVEKSKVSRPGWSTLLGFTFGKRKSVWCPYVIPQSKEGIKEKINRVTNGSKSMSLQSGLLKLSQITIGCCNYYK